MSCAHGQFGGSEPGAELDEGSATMTVCTITDKAMDLRNKQCTKREIFCRSDRLSSNEV